MTGGADALTGVFNAAIGAHALSAAVQLGVLDAIDRDGEAALGDFAAARGLHRGTLDGIARALEVVAVVERDGDVLRPGPTFTAAVEYGAYFHWLDAGYGRVLATLPKLAGADGVEPRAIPRDGAAIAAAGREYGRRFVDPILFPLLRELAPSSVADLGCGSADRLIALARDDASFRGVGIDVNPDAVRLAQAALQAHGVADRVHVVNADVTELPRLPEFARVELLTSLFMAHDLWPRERCRRTLDALQDAFPEARRFLLCDTYRSEAADGAPPIFTLGFEFTHAVMGQYIPLEREWMELFEDTRWTCVDRRALAIPYSAVFVLERR